MTTPSVHSPASVEPATPGAAPPPRRRRWILLTLAIVLVAGGVAVGVSDPFAKSPTATTGVADNADPTSLTTVTRGDLSSQTQVDATLGYAGSYSVVNQAQGTVTSLPTVGQVVSQGRVLYEVNGQPVVLLYGSTPAYRSLSEGASATDLTGPDVQELNADLVALGYVTSAELSPTSDQFSWWTRVGVEDLQAALGVTQNGTLALGQAVFLPTAARVTAVSATLGAPAGPGQPVMSAASTTRQVSIALDAAQQSEVAVGDKVTITLPNNEDTPGVISSVGTVATAPSSDGLNSSDSSPTITVLVSPTDPAATGTWDQAPVEVSITTGAVVNVLVVPVDALLALSNSGYAVEVVVADGIHRLVAVSLGLFDDADGLVQVTGSGLAVGQRVVVPAL
jgi:hypothetical protein